MTLIGIFIGVIGYAFFSGGGNTVGLQSAQTTVAGLLSLVRGQAAVTGRNAALFVNNNAANPDRYLRYLVPVIRNEADDGWDALDQGSLLPQGCYVVPFVTPSGSAVESGASWTNLNSSRLVTSETLPLVSSASEPWVGVEFTPRGTPNPSVGVGNRIVLANARPSPPDPLKWMNPRDVRGVVLTPYGIPRLVNDPSDF